jgi:hypothetical protein
MKPPIIISENGSLIFFRSLAEAERYLEPIDVRNQEYVAYDSEGRRLDLRVEKEVFAIGLLRLRQIARERVRIDQAQEDSAHPEELKNILQDILKKIGISPDWLHSATLQDLVATSAQRMGFH